MAREKSGKGTKLLWIIPPNFSFRSKVTLLTECLQTCAVLSIQAISSRALTRVRAVTVHTSGVHWTIVREIIAFVVICVKICKIVVFFARNILINKRNNQSNK